ncbi:MAG: DUF1289 domain-containing protein [Rhodospirillales bacterium]
MAEQQQCGPVATVASPCIGVCKIDRATGLCSGCLRDLSEIGAWRDADDALRRRILDRIAHRRAARLGFAVPLPAPPEER